MTSKVPSFIKSGIRGLDALGGSRFVKLESGKAIEIIPLTGLEPPDGEDANGTNCVISFQQYAIWMDDLPEGKRSPVFPAIGGKYDPGVLLGITPRFRALLLCMVNGEEDEKILAMGPAIFKELVQIEMATGRSLKGCVLRILRTGSGMATRYKVVFTGRMAEIEGEPETDLLEHIGPTTREEIVQMLTEVGQWPPPGGDPALEVKAAKPVRKTIKADVDKPIAGIAAISDEYDELSD